MFSGPCRKWPRIIKQTDQILVPLDKLTVISLAGWMIGRDWISAALGSLRHSLGGKTNIQQPHSPLTHTHAHTFLSSLMLYAWHKEKKTRLFLHSFRALRRKSRLYDVLERLIKGSSPTGNSCSGAVHDKQMASNRALSVQRRVVTLDENIVGGGKERKKKNKCSGWIQAICLQNNKVSFLREGKNSFFRRLAAQHIAHNSRAFVFSLTFRALQSQKGCCVMMFASFPVGEGEFGGGGCKVMFPLSPLLNLQFVIFFFSPGVCFSSTPARLSPPRPSLLSPVILHRVTLRRGSVGMRPITVQINFPLRVQRQMRRAQEGSCPEKALKFTHMQGDVAAVAKWKGVCPPTHVEKPGDVCLGLASRLLAYSTVAGGAHFFFSIYTKNTTCRQQRGGAVTQSPLQLQRIAPTLRRHAPP